MKRKKSIAGRLGMAAFALTLVTTCISGGTLAKYTSEVEGTGTAIAAKWSFKAGVNSGSTSDSKIADFDLSTTRTSNSAVASTKLGPGTSGKSTLNFDLTGTEVSTKVTAYVKITSEEAAKLPTNLEIKVKDGNGTKWVKPSALSEYTEVESVSKKLSDITTSPTGYIEVEWRWTFDESGNTSKDTQDTDDGKDSTKNSTGGKITVKLTAEQLETDPTA